MKVLHLPYNISSVISNSVRILKANGTDAKGIAYTKLKTMSVDDVMVLEDYWFDNSLRKKLKQLEYTFFFHRWIRWADVLHYYWNADVLPFNLEFKIANWYHKPALVEFLGSEIRIPEVEYSDNIYYKRMMEKYNEKGDFSKYENSDRTQKKFSEAGFSTVTSPGMDTYLLPQYFSGDIHYLRQRIVLDEFIPVYPDSQNKVPLVVHGSTSPFGKGSEFVKEAVEALKQKYNFDFFYMEKIPRDEALKMMQRADIFIDQLILGHHGFAAVEAMAFGKPVICFIKPTLRNKYPDDLPIVSANPDTIYNELEKLLINAQLRNELGLKGRAYVEKYHHPKILAKEMVNIYQELIDKNKE